MCHAKFVEGGGVRDPLKKKPYNFSYWHMRIGYLEPLVYLTEN